MDICCSICMGPFTSKSDVSATMCGHIFHTDCLNEWLQQKEIDYCPQCRKKCERIHKIFFSARSENTKLLEETVQRNNDLEKQRQTMEEAISGLNHICEMYLQNAIGKSFF